MSREDQVRDAVDRFIARVRQETDARLQDLAAELLQVAQGDMRASRVDVERAAVEVARAAARGGSRAHPPIIDVVLTALRRMDDATTLRGILDILADGALAVSPKVAVLVVGTDSLHVYRQHGFEPGHGPVDVEIDASPILAAAVQLKQSTTVSSVGDRPDPRLPAFMRVPPGHTGALSPLVVDRHVAALVYGEGPERLAHETRGPAWMEPLEVLVRHAAARLENVTSQRTVEVLSNPS